MNVTDAIHARRAYRSLEPVEITNELVEDLAAHAGLAASCFNHQPWRFVFVYERSRLEEMWGALSRSNKWAELASMIVAVFTRPEDDCQIRDRAYHQFDAGMATAHLILRATERGLVAHPIAGFSPKKVRETLGIPDGYQVITLVNVGRKAEAIHPYLSEDQAETEARRPERYPLERFAFHNAYTGE
ncbi:nitroreductase family protein [Candidatus Bathyarchaeota archaeon]|nr:nitroreductase family protein [Candidatus Bathyarchaeota archaeon]